MTTRGTQFGRTMEYFRTADVDEARAAFNAAADILKSREAFNAYKPRAVKSPQARRSKLAQASNATVGAVTAAVEQL